MPENVGGWTDERIATLTSLWGQGLTASEVAEQMGNGLSRCAIIGKVHRLKLNRSTGYENEPNYERPAPREKSVGHRPFYKSVFKSRERKPHLNIPAPNAKPAIGMVMSVITGNPLKSKRMLPRQPEMSKTEMRAMLAEAAQNTADLDVA